MNKEPTLKDVVRSLRRIESRLSELISQKESSRQRSQMIQRFLCTCYRPYDDGDDQMIPRMCPLHGRVEEEIKVRF